MNIKMATAANDNQNPGRRLASGSNTSTPTKASSQAHHGSGCLKRKRHNSTRPIIAQARRTGTSKPASKP
ncbi:hypothetical protein D3C76_1596530 [compost metagenome]